MATRSTIALEFADGTVEAVYCHWDGYIENNGLILRDHYSDPFKLRELIDLGDLSVLGPNIGTKHAFHKDVKGECTFYGRDRNETACTKRKFANYADYRAKLDYQEYNYILRQVNGKATWFVRARWDDLDCTLDEAILKGKVAEDM